MCWTAATWPRTKEEPQLTSSTRPAATSTTGTWAPPGRSRGCRPTASPSAPACWCRSRTACCTLTTHHQLDVGAGAVGGRHEPGQAGARRAALQLSRSRPRSTTRRTGSLERFSIGTYVSPDTTFDTLADFSRQAQAQTPRGLALRAGGRVGRLRRFRHHAPGGGGGRGPRWRERVRALQSTAVRRVRALRRAAHRGLGAGPASGYFQAIGNQVGFAGGHQSEGTYNVDTMVSRHPAPLGP